MRNLIADIINWKGRNMYNIEEKDSILLEDIKYIAANEKELLSNLKNSVVLITGATGLLGSQIIKTLLYADYKLALNIQIIGICRSMEKAGAVFGEASKGSNFTIIQGDIRNSFDIEQRIDYMIHCASITKSKEFVTCPAETIWTSLAGTRNMLELAKRKECRGFVFLSSLEVYGQVSKEMEVTETDLGYIDFLDVRSSYSEGKRMAECICSAYCKEYAVPVKLVRLCQTFGAGVNYNDTRVFAEFARNVIERKNIVLHTQGNTCRNYLYTRDAVVAILRILIFGEVGEAYNVANEEAVLTIKEMAQLIVKLFPEAGIDIEYDIGEDVSKWGYNNEMVIKLNTDKIKKLGWNAKIHIKEMLVRMIWSMEERK